MGCLILAIIGLAYGIWQIVNGLTGSEQPVGTVALGLGFVIICAIPIVSFVRKQVQGQRVQNLPEQTRTVQPLPQAGEMVQPMPPQQSSSGGVLFVPLPLDEQNRQREG